MFILTQEWSSVFSFEDIWQALKGRVSGSPHVRGIEGVKLKSDMNLWLLFSNYGTVLDVKWACFDPRMIQPSWVFSSQDILQALIGRVSGNLHVRGMKGVKMCRAMYFFSFPLLFFDPLHLFSYTFFKYSQWISSIQLQKTVYSNACCMVPNPSLSLTTVVTHLHYFNALYFFLSFF